MIVGLGNPGLRYQSSRHNVGFMVLDRLAKVNGIEFARRRFNALLAEGIIEGEPVLLAKPQAFMNLSGQPTAKLARYFRFSIHDIIIVYDDVDLPLGRMRMRPSGGAGGHHGMESIINALGREDFARLRIGIGRPDSREDIAHVLGSFRDVEQLPLDQLLERAGGALQVWVKDGIEKAMNEFNN